VVFCLGIHNISLLIFPVNMNSSFARLPVLLIEIGIKRVFIAWLWKSFNHLLCVISEGRLRYYCTFNFLHLFFN